MPPRRECQPALAIFLCVPGALRSTHSSKSYGLKRGSAQRVGPHHSCTRKIVSQNGQLGIKIESEYEISLGIVDEAAVVLTRLLTKADQIESMAYIAVHCGGAWTIDGHGYLLKLKSKTRGVRRQFVAKKDCSGPCLREIEEVEPERRQN
ncbi:MAG: hypothetical protein ACI9TP_001469 [Candidatus Azotimanducaceae bacterium]|jgi:hypothetical protein